jgi:hypothetical protein
VSEADLAEAAGRLRHSETECDLVELRARAGMAELADALDLGKCAGVLIARKLLYHQQNNLLIPAGFLPVLAVVQAQNKPKT